MGMVEMDLMILKVFSNLYDSTILNLQLISLSDLSLWLF